MKRYITLMRGVNKTEPHPGRWTTHIVIGDPTELDAELLNWVAQAYAFAENKTGGRMRK